MPTFSLPPKRVIRKWWILSSNIVRRTCRDTISRSLQDIQVLTPMQRGECGAVNLNQVLQEAMNRQRSFCGEAAHSTG